MNMNMDAETRPNTPAVGTIVAITVGAVGIVLGGIALAKDRQTRSTLEQLRAEIEALKTSTANAEQTSQRLATQANRAFQEVAQQIGNLDLRLNAFAARLASVNAQLGSQRANNSLPPPAVAPAESPAPSASPATGSGKTYVVETGDNFAKIAKKLNVSVEALQKANPDANPTKLRVGQKLNVP